MATKSTGYQKYWNSQKQIYINDAYNIIPENKSSSFYNNEMIINIHLYHYKSNKHSAFWFCLVICSDSKRTISTGQFQQSREVVRLTGWRLSDELSLTTIVAGQGHAFTCVILRNKLRKGC